MKNIKELKRNLLRKLGKSYIKSVDDLGELVALHHFVKDSSDENYIQYIIWKLIAEEKRLKKNEIPVDKWPKQLRGDWVGEIWKSFGIEPPPPTPPVVTAVSQ